MTLGPATQIAAFGILSLVSVLGALGMATTMSMFRSGIFLMASFLGVSGLFILLSADLLGLLQVMMYIGGMLVMVLFMVLFSHDPGGEMMAGMQLPWPERLFSRGLLPREDAGRPARVAVELATRPEAAAEGEGAGGEGGGHAGPERGDGGHAGPGHAGQDHDGHDHASPAHDSHDHDDRDHDRQDYQAEDHGDEDHGGEDHEGMDHGGMDMSMVTPVRPCAAALGIATGALLIALLLWRPAWPVADGGSVHPDSARRIGELLMGKYMMAFEGAGLLILTGIFGAVYLGRPDRHPSPSGRDAFVGRAVAPPALDDDRLEPLFRGPKDAAAEPEGEP